MNLNLKLIQSTEYPDAYCGYDRGCQEVGDTMLSIVLWLIIFFFIRYTK